MKNSKKYISWFTVLILGLVFTMQFIPAKGIAASEENTAISFRFEGVVSSYEEMKAQDNSFEVYVKAQGDTEYKTLAQAASDNNGVYSLIVIRNHNGEITKLDTTANEGTISFETNRFSTYVILKKEKSGAGQDSSDTAESGVDAGIGEIKNSMTDSPVTGYDDMAGLYVCLMFMSVLVSSAVLKKSAGV